jgi:hypothetical protein
MNLTWNIATGYADGDVPCSNLNPQAISQHTDLVVVSGGGEFDFQSADDFLTPNPDINGDFLNPFVGSCKSSSRKDALGSAPNQGESRKGLALSFISV